MDADHYDHSIDDDDGDDDDDGSDPLHNAVDAILMELIETLPVRPGWYDRWRELTPASAAADRLLIYQEIRDSSLFPREAGLYMIAWEVDALMDDHDRGESVLAPLNDRLDAIEEALAVADEGSQQVTDLLAERARTLQEYHQIVDGLFADELEKQGESWIAELYRTDREEYARQHEIGRRYFHGQRPLTATSDLDWLDSLIEIVGSSLEPHGPMAPLGILYREEEGDWEVDIYPTPVELVGGAEDGAVVSPSFSLDLEALRDSFNQVRSCGWNALGWPDGLGPFVWLEGDYLGSSVFLRVLAQAPEGEEPGSKLKIPQRAD